MDTVTYPDKNVVSFLTENFVLLKVPFAHDEEMVKKFNATWTPTFIILDSEGKEHDRFVGYLPPDDYISHLKFAKAKVFFDRNRLDAAIDIFRDVLDSHEKSEKAPEAAYLLGVGRYKKSHNAEDLKNGWKTTLDKYPESEWSKKVSFLFE